MAYPSRTKLLDTATVATLEDALHEYDIPQAFRNTVLLRILLGNTKEPGLTIQGQPSLPSLPVKRRTKGGARAEVFPNFETGVTAQWFNGLDVLDTSISNGPTVSWVDWAFLTCYVAISGTEKLKNTGPMKRLDILRSRQNQEIRAKSRLAETALWSANTDTTEGSQNAFAGIRHKLTTAASGTLQGLDRATFTTFVNQFTTSAGSFASGGLDFMRAMYFNTAGVNGMEPCHVIFMDSDGAGYMIKALEGVHRVVGDIGQKDLSTNKVPTFMGIPVIYTDDATAGYQFWLNFDYIENLIMEGANWSSHIPGRPNDQFVEDQKRWILGAAPLMLTRPEKQGIITGITA